MKLIQVNDNLWALYCSFEQRAIAKQHRFAWHPKFPECRARGPCPACKIGVPHRVWWTTDPAQAAAFAKYADEGQSEALSKLEADLERAEQMSRALDWDIEIAGLARELFPFQRAAVAYGLEHPCVLIADEMGTCKSASALALLHMKNSFPAIVVCPAHLRINWRNEVRSTTPQYTTHIIQGTKPDLLPKSDIYITGYNTLEPWMDSMKAVSPAAIVYDELHFLKDSKSRRGRVSLQLSRYAPVVIGLSGTPAPNRVKEFVHPLTILRVIEKFGGPWRFLNRYCDPKIITLGRPQRNDGNLFERKKKPKQFRTFDGASRLDELEQSLRRHVMVRRRKADVLLDLPPKLRAVIELPAEGLQDVIDQEREFMQAQEERMRFLKTAVELAKASDDPQDYEDAVDALRHGVTAAFAEMSKLRHRTAVAQLPFVIEHIRELTEDPSFKCVVFGHHRDVIDGIVGAFPDKATKIDGSVSAVMRRDGTSERQARVDRFQNQASLQIIVGEFTAMGTGLTLTASSHVIFAEGDWVPGTLTQCEDRLHRVGATAESIMVQHFVLEGSLMATMAKRVVDKQRDLDAALDGLQPQSEAFEPLVPIEEAGTAKLTRAKVTQGAAEIDLAMVSLVHQGVRTIVGSVNGQGFSRIDQGIGGWLARREWISPKQAILAMALCKKYRSYLPNDFFGSGE